MTVPIVPGAGGGGGNVVEIRVTSRDDTAAGFDSATKRAKKLGDEVGRTGQDVDDLKRKTTGLGLAFADVGKVAGGVLLADVIQEGARKVKDLVSSTIHAASSLNESLNAVDKTFGSSAKIIHDWGDNNAAAFGLSTRAFNEAATPLGAMLKNFGFTADEVAKQTINLTKRAADMGSVFNVDVAETLTAVQAALRGETEPIRRFGVSLNAVTIEQQAMAATGKTSTAQLTAQDKAVATLKAIMEQTATTQGDFADTSDQMANATRRANAEIENMKAVIGKEFIPVVAFGENLLVEMAKTVERLPAPVTLVVAAVGALAASLLVLAPRIVATRTALLEMAASESVVQRATANTIVTVGKLAAAFVGLQIAGQLLSATLGSNVNVQVDALSDSMQEFAKTGKVSGEAARVFGSDLSDLNYDLGTLGSGGMAQFGNAVAGVVESIGLGSDFDQSLTHAKERISGIDAALAKMVADGHPEIAAQIFQLLAERGAEVGISIDDLKAGLPQYAAAMKKGTAATEDLGAVAKVAAMSLDQVSREIKDMIDDAFGLGEAEDKVADDVDRLTEQIKRQHEEGEKGAGTLDRNTQAGRDNAAAVRGMVRDYEELYVQYQKNGKSTEELKQKLHDQLIAMGFNEQATADYVAQLDQVKASIDLIPKEVHITIKSDVEQALEQIHETDVEAHRANRRRSGGITGAAAGGGPRGARTIVGEGGWELVDLPYGSTVHSHEDSMRMMSQGGGWGGGSTHITLGSDGTQLGDVLIWLIAASVRAKGGRPDILGITNLPTAS